MMCSDSGSRFARHSLRPPTTSCGNKGPLVFWIWVRDLKDRVTFSKLKWPQCPHNHHHGFEGVAIFLGLLQNQMDHPRWCKLLETWIRVSFLIWSTFSRLVGLRCWQSLYESQLYRYMRINYMLTVCSQIYKVPLKTTWTADHLQCGSYWNGTVCLSEVRRHFT